MSNPGSKREVCKCGHAKDTHFADEVRTVPGPDGNGMIQIVLYGSCLGMRCDCICYRDESEPSTMKVLAAKRYSNRVDPTRPRPHVQYTCRCRACVEWIQQQHASDCMCDVCFGVP